MKTVIPFLSSVLCNQQIYVGTFRDGKREGRGVEYCGSSAYTSDVVVKIDTAAHKDSASANSITYKGEFSNDLRHGFGVAYFSEGHRYLGRFEAGSMSGIGLYIHPNGERYEGMFYTNKPDGVGSFYQKDPASGAIVAAHAQWQLGRRTKELSMAFEPNKAVDLPDESVNVSFF